MAVRRTAELDAQALQLWDDGRTYRQIAAEQECDVHTAHRRVQRARNARELARQVAEGLEAAR